MKMPRSFYMPEADDLTPVDCSGTDSEVFTYSSQGAVYAVAFHGKAQKPDWHFRFPSAERRDKHIADYLAGRRATAAYKEKRKAEYKAAGRGLEVGDILRQSWGYDQTNINYFEVTALIGSAMVEIREIGAERVETGYMQGQSVPLPGHYIGEPKRKVAKNGSVKIFDWGSWASKMEYQTLAGVRVYGASRWTAYA